MSAMLGESYDIDKKNLLNILAVGSNDAFPALVWEVYNNGNEADSQYALDALLNSTYMDMNFAYDDFDYMIYSDRIIKDLKSTDEFTRSAAIQLIDKILKIIRIMIFMSIFTVKALPRMYLKLCVCTTMAVTLCRSN